GARETLALVGGKHELYVAKGDRIVYERQPARHRPSARGRPCSSVSPPRWTRTCLGLRRVDTSRILKKYACTTSRHGGGDHHGDPEDSIGPGGEPATHFRLRPCSRGQQEFHRGDEQRPGDAAQHEWSVRRR